MELSEGTDKREGSFSQIRRVSTNPNFGCDENSNVSAEVERNCGVSYVTQRRKAGVKIIHVLESVFEQQVIGDGSKTTRVSNNPSASFHFGTEANQTAYVAAIYDQDATVSNMVTHHDIISELFGVSLKTYKDFEDFISNIELGTSEVWLELFEEKRQEVTDIFCAKFKAFKAENCDVSNPSKFMPSDPIVQSVDINTKSTSYAGAAGASANDQPKLNSNFCPLVADPVFDGVNISIPRRVVEKVSTRFEHTLYGYFIRKRMAFLVVKYYARNNWVKHGLKRIMMNTKGFFFFKFDSRAGLEAVLEGGPWLIHNSPIILKKWSMDTKLLKEELTRIPIWVKLHDVPIQVFEEDGISLIATFIGKPADLMDVVTIGIPSLIGDDFTKETIRVEYEWRLPRCDICKIFGHVHDHFPKKVVSPPIVATSNVVTPTVEKTNDGFQTVGKRKKRKGKSKSTNYGQFAGPSVKPNVRYEPKATTSAPKKRATHVGNASKSSSMLKTTYSSFKNDNIATYNSYFALNDEKEDVENVYDETANLFPNSKTSGSSSFMKISKGGAERVQLEKVSKLIDSIELVEEQDKWVWNLEGDGVFKVASARRFIDEGLSEMEGVQTRWVKLVPIKVNVFAWRVALNKLPTRFNMSSRGLEISSIVCPVCDVGA
ncbi:zinc knuckle CX2CX4HX4C containing protein [Tanacetum coccineum]